jgi:HAD superfamily hydrolase (TIGR01509 family)
MKPSAILLDFDGVIACSEATHVKAWLHAAGLSRQEMEDPEFRQLVSGQPTNKILQIVAKRWPAISKSDLEERKWHALKLLISEIALFPAVRELMATLTMHEIPHAIVSSSPRDFILQVLSHHDLAAPLVIAKEDVKKVKPSPEALFLAAKTLGLSLDKYKFVCMIEDSFQGIKAARAAQMIPLGVTTTAPGHRLLQAGAKLIYPDVENFLSLGHHLHLPV